MNCTVNMGRVTPIIDWFILVFLCSNVNAKKPADCKTVGVFSLPSLALRFQTRSRPLVVLFAHKYGLFCRLKGRRMVNVACRVQGINCVWSRVV